MVARILGAGLRALWVALLVATPSLLLPGLPGDTAPIAFLVALFAGMLVFVEYVSSTPSIIEFRDAPPFNRIRFACLYLTVLITTLIMRDSVADGTVSGALADVGMIIGNSIDFPFSPVRLVILMLPSEMNIDEVNCVRSTAGLAYLLSIMTIGLFLIVVRFRNWPTGRGSFNFWVNLPLFDPTTGGDVLHRLQRDGTINIALGFLLPFLVPAVVDLFSFIIDPALLTNPQTLIWTVTAWAFLPASLIMRGVAMLRISELIEAKRKRAYAKAEALHA